jgi:hypothetical protein
MSWGRQGHFLVRNSIEVQLPWLFLAAASKELVFVPSTGWSLLGDFRYARGWGERTASTGPISISPGVQLASDPRTYGSPNGWRDLGDSHSNTVYVRAGWVVALPDATGVQHVAATGVVELSAAQ